MIESILQEVIRNKLFNNYLFPNSYNQENKKFVEKI